MGRFWLWWTNKTSNKQINFKLSYFPNDQLKSFSLYFDNLINNTNSAGLFKVGDVRYIGTWYTFNETGEIIKIIDFEKDYKTSFLDIFLIARKKINELISKGTYKYARHLPRFERNKNEQDAFWQLYISDNYYMIINDATGKVIEEVKSSDFDNVQKKFSKYMKPNIEYNKAINEFFEYNLLPTSND